MPVPIKVLKPVVFLLCLVPLAALIWAIVFHPETFSADPYADITDRTGDWTLRFVLITLAITPLRQISGWNGAVRFRRMLGLFAFFGFVLMLPLAITSTKKWISRLGGKRWQRLHQAIYLTGILGVIHYIWRVKSDIQNPLIYAILLTLLLGYRLWNKFRTASVVR